MVRNNPQHSSLCRNSGANTTCHIVSDSHCGKSDHNKVDGIQCGPALDVLEYDCGDGDEDDAASQDEEDDRRHPDLRLADLFVFLLQRTNRSNQSDDVSVTCDPQQTAQLHI